MNFNINIHVNEHENRCDFLEVLGGIAGALEALAPQSNKEKKRMALSTAEQAIVDRFNTATTAIANRIRDLIANPPADDAEFNSVLSGIADGLDALGAPATPVPGPGPQPTP